MVRQNDGISAEYSVRGAGSNSNRSSTPTVTAIRCRCCGNRLPRAASAPAKRMDRPSAATTAKRVGVRADPMSGTYRSSAQGPGTYVLTPAMDTKGPNDNAAKPAVSQIQPARGRYAARHIAHPITAIATRLSADVYSMNNAPSDSC